jgi:hypothetical protein
MVDFIGDAVDVGRAVGRLMEQGQQASSERLHLLLGFGMGLAASGTRVRSRAFSAASRSFRSLRRAISMASRLFWS